VLKKGRDESEAAGSSGTRAGVTQHTASPIGGEAKPVQGTRRVTTMANAKERNDKQRRVNLLERLAECDTAKLKEYVKSEKLPGSTKDWSLDQISAALTALHPVPKEAAAAAGKTTTGKPAGSKRATAAPAHFSVQYETEKAGETVQVQGFNRREDADKATAAVKEGSKAHSVSTAADLASVPTPVLIAIVNKTKETPVAKFASKEAAQESAFGSLARVAEESAPRKAKAKAPAQPRVPKPIAYEPRAKSDIKVVKAGTKIANIIDLLARAKGTTLEEIEKEGSKTGKPISARAWLGYDLNKVAGYGVREEAGRLYIVLPKGMTAPHDHKVPEVKKPAAKKGGAVKADAKGKKEPVAGAEVEVAEEPAKKVRRPGGKKQAAAA
jgi:hypothetical protein